MANPIEAAGKYALSVADRTTGFSGFKEILSHIAKRDSNKELTPYSVETAIGVIAPLTSRVTESIEKYLSPPMERGPADLMLVMFSALIPAALDVYIGAALIDAVVPSAQLFIEGRNPLASIIHNPLEAVTAKLMINSATNIGWDLGCGGINLAKAAVNKIRHLRPPELYQH